MCESHIFSCSSLESAAPVMRFWSQKNGGFEKIWKPSWLRTLGPSHPTFFLLLIGLLCGSTCSRSRVVIPIREQLLSADGGIC